MRSVRLDLPYLMADTDRHGNPAAVRAPARPQGADPGETGHGGLCERLYRRSGGARERPCPRAAAAPSAPPVRWAGWSPPIRIR
jgi:hypothetical protein